MYKSAIILSILCIIVSCFFLMPAKGDSPMQTRGTIIDITEDFHHRMLSGILDLRKEPVIVSVVKTNRSSTSFKDLPDAYLNVNWELGSFWVKTDKNGLVVMHWNTDAIYGHVKVAASTDGDGTQRFFPQYPQHPIMITRFKE